MITSTHGLKNWRRQVCIIGTMIRISDKWREISMSEGDLTLLRKIRILMGWINSKESN
jgi:hypothetical protein